MASKKKIKGFNPRTRELRKVLRFGVGLLEPEEIEEIEARVPIMAEKRCLSHPTCWQYCLGRDLTTYRIKEILNYKAGRPINDYRAGAFNLDNLREIAGLIGVEDGHSEKIDRVTRWKQILEKVKQEEDSPMNRLRKVWAWLEERVDVTDVDYLMVHAPGYWKDRECYLDPDWRLRHLSNIFEISFIIQEVVDAKLKVQNRIPVVSGLSKLQLWVITHEIMNLEVPHSATKEVMWQNILAEIK